MTESSGGRAVVVITAVVCAWSWSWIAPSVGAQVGRLVPTDVEAWYTITPQPAPPGLPPVNPYPPDTLHVGITSGAEDSRTYLSLDLSALSPDATVVGGTLELPVDPDGGSRNLASADFEVCLVDDPGPEVTGSLDPPPEVDCSLTSQAVLEDQGDDGVQRFVVDLSVFAGQLSQGGLALLPNEAARSATASWHVAFFGRENDSVDAEPISARLDLVDVGSSPSPGGGASVAGPRAQPPSRPTLSLPDFGVPGQLPTVPGPIGDTSGAPAPTEPGPGAGGSTLLSPLLPVGSGGGEGFRYGVIFVLPIAILVLGGYFGSVLTRSADPVS